MKKTYSCRVIHDEEDRLQSYTLFQAEVKCLFLLLFIFFYIFLLIDFFIFIGLFVYINYI